jgi:hypothetical protein
LTDKSTKHNWFSEEGDIRVNEKMTTKEFLNLMESSGWEFVGKVGYSVFSDDDFNKAMDG